MSAGTPPGGPDMPARRPDQPYADLPYADQAPGDAERTQLSPPVEDETEQYLRPDAPADATDPTQIAVPRHRRLLGGRYEIGDVLGYGGMAEVFRGRDIRLSREVAVKVLRSDLARDPSFQMRFRREAQAAASLNHPAIVAVYDTGEGTSGGATVPYIVMEYVEGRTLRDVLQQEGRLTVQRSLEITADVCAALEFSHRAGIIHRDIKPGNVMLTRDGVVKVMDFGIARAITGSSATMTQTAAVMGTAQYLSPEQARGETVDARSDVYSTGVLLFELLTGYPPFRGESPVAVAYQHVREDPQPASRLDPDIPPDVDAVVMKALAKNPANRYQSAGEFREDLLRAAVGQPVMATPLLPYEAATEAMPPRSSYPGYQPTGYPPPRAAQKSSRRNLIWIIILAILGLGAIGALAVSQLSKGPTVTVPNVVGATLAQAQNQLSTTGLQLGTVSYQQDSTKPANTVLSQDPAANATAHKNDKVDVVLNGTQEQVTIPSGIIGAPIASATSQLQSLGLVVKTNQVDSGGDPGTVTNCSPSPGTRVDKGSTVTLSYVSSLSTVPSVVGLSQSAAQSQLASKGFTVNVQQQQATSNPGFVLSQNPAGGTQQQRGSTVTIVVSQVVTPTSPPPTTPTPTPTPTPTTTPTTTTNPPKTTTPPVSSAASSAAAT